MSLCNPWWERGGGGGGDEHGVDEHMHGHGTRQRGMAAQVSQWPSSEISLTPLCLKHPKLDKPAMCPGGSSPQPYSCLPPPLPPHFAPRCFREKGPRKHETVTRASSSQGIYSRVTYPGHAGEETLGQLNHSCIGNACPTRHGLIMDTHLLRGLIPASMKRWEASAAP